MRGGISPLYRKCRKCGKEWNVSRIDPGEKTYICPTCEYKENLAKRAAQRKKEIT